MLCEMRRKMSVATQEDTNKLGFLVFIAKFMLLCRPVAL